MLVFFAAPSQVLADGGTPGVFRSRSNTWPRKKEEPRKRAKKESRIGKWISSAWCVGGLLYQARDTRCNHSKVTALLRLLLPGPVRSAMNGTEKIRIGISNGSHVCVAVEASSSPIRTKDAL